MSLNKISSFVLILTLLVIISSFSQSYADTSPNANANSNDTARGEVMISSATIIGFAGFGSILALRLQGEQLTGQIICSIIMFVAILAEIILHLYVMWAAYANELIGSVYGSVMVATMFMVGIIVICFAVITVFQYGLKSKDQKVDHFVKTAIDDTTSIVFEERGLGAPIKRNPSRN